MNGNFYQNPTFPTNGNDSYQNMQIPNDSVYTQNTPLANQGTVNEQSYIENILRMNKGKNAKFFVSYPESSAWQNKQYTGIIEEAGKDHLIVKDNTTGSWYLIRLIYLDYVEFMEPINYFKN